MSQIINLIFDIAIFGALSVIIYYCIRLSRQFNQLRDDKASFENFIKTMNIATARAESAIKAMKEAINDEGEALQDKINKGKGLEEELEIIIQAGDSLANRLEEASSKNNKPSHGRKRHEEDDAEEEQPKTQAEKNLIEAIRAKHK